MRNAEVTCHSILVMCFVLFVDLISFCGSFIL
jgi:hypothetical protein